MILNRSKCQPTKYELFKKNFLAKYVLFTLCLDEFNLQMNVTELKSILTNYWLNYWHNLDVCMYVFIYDLLRWTFYNWERAWNNDKYMVPSWACKTQMIIIITNRCTLHSWLQPCLVNEIRNWNVKIKVVILNKNECTRGNIVSLFNNTWIDLISNEMFLQQNAHVMCHFHDHFLVASGGLYFKSWFLPRC